MEEKLVQIQLEQTLKDIEQAIQEVKSDSLRDLMEMKKHIDDLCARVVRIRTQNPDLIGQNILTIISRLEELQTEVELYKDRMTEKMS